MADGWTLKRLGGHGFVHDVDGQHLVAGALSTHKAQQPVGRVTPSVDERHGRILTHDLALNGLRQQDEDDLSCLRRLAVKYACLMYTTPDAPGVPPRPEIRIRGGFAASDL